MRSMSGMARAWAARAFAKEERPVLREEERLAQQMLEELSRSAGPEAYERIVKEGLRNGASARYQEPKRGESAAHLAASRGGEGALTALLEAGADVEAKNKNGMTPLHKAAKSGSLECVRALLRAGADAEAVWATGMSAMHLAAMIHHAPICSELVRAGAKVGVADIAGKFPESYALEAKRPGGEAFAQALKTLRLAEESFEQAEQIAAAMAPSFDAGAGEGVARRASSARGRRL